MTRGVTPFPLMTQSGPITRRLTAVRNLLPLAFSCGRVHPIDLPSRGGLDLQMKKVAVASFEAQRNL